MLDEFGEAVRPEGRRIWRRPAAGAAILSTLEYPGLPLQDPSSAREYPLSQIWRRRCADVIRSDTSSLYILKLVIYAGCICI